MLLIFLSENLLSNSKLLLLSVTGVLKLTLSITESREQRWLIFQCAESFSAWFDFSQNNLLWVRFTRNIVSRQFFYITQQLFKFTDFNKIILMLRCIQSKDTLTISIQQNTAWSQSTVLIQPFVWPSSCVYGCWCERLGQNLGTIHQQYGLVSLYIHTNHNCLNDTSFNMVHVKCVTQTHQHPTRTLLCRPFDSRCQPLKSAEH